MTNIPNIPLNDGNVIPQFGLGVWRTAPAETQAIVEHALSVGYRHIDTAALYENEREVGRAVRASGVPRERVFVTTKLWNDRQLDARAALEESLEKLGFDYVNLYLVHWPVPQQNTYADAWRTLIELRADGLTRSIGVSNFEAEHLDRVMAEGVTPAVNQIELHPTFAQFDLVDANTAADRHPVVAPAGHGEDLDNPTVAGIAAATGKTRRRSCCAGTCSGADRVPKSRQPHWVTENLDVFDFELTPDQMAAINALDAGNRMGGDPRVFAG